MKRRRVISESEPDLMLISSKIKNLPLLFSEIIWLHSLSLWSQQHQKDENNVQLQVEDPRKITKFWKNRELQEAIVLTEEGKDGMAVSKFIFHYICNGGVLACPNSSAYSRINTSSSHIYK